MYLIIVGLGGIGRNLVDIATKDKNDVVVIDQNEKRCREIAARYDVLTILGDATQKSILEEAEASRANALIATTSDDAANLMMSLTAKGLGTKKIVAVVNQEEHVEMFKEAEIFLFENPDMTVASHLYFSVKRPKIKDFLTVSGGKAEIFEVVVSPESPVVGSRLSKLRIKGGLVVAIERNGDVILPRGNTVIQTHDLVTIFAKAPEVEEISLMFAP
ncbi:potassium transporter [ANME-1 cluster archaeon ex4572_4]|nr:TrkA family potassium uptake protein [Methanophagales archaeon]OYT67056.1 MAG: potassium transporter [ANME-1 cluster archaeon ex4572_4]HDN68705.1 TrkA family potassium uptake protein [Methanomicrobia archaeon]